MFSKGISAHSIRKHLSFFSPLRNNSMAVIAFLGTGLMGSGMAGCLLRAGHEVRVYNRTAAKVAALSQPGGILEGAEVASSPAEAVRGAEVIFSMLGDDEASRAIWSGPRGVLAGKFQPGALAIECSTLSHDWVLELADLAAKAGLDYLDCPVTGLPMAAASGNLVLFLGGSKATIDRALPLLEVLSTDQIHFGETGSGTAYKLIVNLMGSIQIAAAAEGLVTAERAGLDLDLVAMALASGGCGSPQVARNAALMVRGEHDKDVLFSTRWRLKDTDYGLRFASKMGLEQPLGAGAAQAFTAAKDDGYSDLAESSVIESLRKTLPKK
ncbi:NAD(P)-dependent oxidoreductase [Kiloniella laminariae]|uniref:NAD(P)-dependent oxidoreductase n=1 Tax=Kiloniella laminariae TaxID=454162 RepID=A0ABT4LID5_9PROT|nr:NAD(P)-dependent oxidoreductase [Kiloniella laminariae]MCZ4279762.1 NAD(P)-dependent oxidoreductase [Kiloniella laminariae]